MLPPRAVHFSTLHLLASLQRQNSRWRAQTVAFAGAPLRGQGTPKNLQCALSGHDFQRSRTALFDFNMTEKPAGSQWNFGCFLRSRKNVPFHPRLFVVT
jgi:hypothetical protein